MDVPNLSRRSRRRLRREVFFPPQTQNNTLSPQVTPTTSTPSQRTPCSGKSRWGPVFGYLSLACLVAATFLLLEYHCRACSANDDLKLITDKIDSISKNLTAMKESYHVLETKLSKLTNDFPKVESQIEILQALAGPLDFDDWKENTKPYVSYNMRRNDILDDTMRTSRSCRF